jgi:hypothetical protein
MDPIGTAGPGGSTAATPLCASLGHTSRLCRPGEAGSFVAAVNADTAGAPRSAAPATPPPTRPASRRGTPRRAPCASRWLASPTCTSGIIGLRYGSARPRPAGRLVHRAGVRGRRRAWPATADLTSWSARTRGICRGGASRRVIGPGRTRIPPQAASSEPPRPWAAATSCQVAPALRGGVTTVALVRRSRPRGSVRLSGISALPPTELKARQTTPLPTAIHAPGVATRAQPGESRCSCCWGDADALIRGGM